MKPSKRVLAAIKSTFRQWEAYSDAMEYLPFREDDHPFPTASSVALFVGRRNGAPPSVRIVLESPDPMAGDGCAESLPASCTYDEFERIVLGLLVQAGAKLDLPEPDPEQALAPGEDPFAL